MGDAVEWQTMAKRKKMTGCLYQVALHEREKAFDGVDEGSPKYEELLQRLYDVVREPSTPPCGECESCQDQMTDRPLASDEYDVIPADALPEGHG